MNRDPEVDAWLERYDNPMKPVVIAVRDVILAADDRITESIKWQAPTFSYKGNLASFFPKSRSHASLMFHKGATIRGDFPNLEGEGREARTMKFADLAQVEARTAELQKITVAWCDQMEAR
jgi:hypothetical protein